MKTNSLQSLFLFISIVFFLASCNSKVPYGSSYYFPQQKKEVAKKESSVNSQTSIASIEKVAPQGLSVESLIRNADKKISMNGLLKQTESTKQNQINTSEEASRLSKKEIRQNVKENRKELKSILKEYKKDIKEIKNDKAEKAASKNLTLGIILAAIGLLLLLLLPGGVGYVLGTIALVIGIVLIILDLV